jgi:hypothetical protein
MTPTFDFQRSYGQSKPVELDYGNQMQSGDFPDWLPQKAPVGGLQRAQKQLKKFFDFAPIQQAGNAYIDSNFQQQRAATGAAARAAQNRAMLSGGRVGSSFAQASAMLPLYAQKNQQALGLAQLQGQMNSQRAGLNTSLAQSISQQRLGKQNLLADYAMGQQRLGQDQQQFDERMRLSNDQFGLQRAQFNAGLAQDAMKMLGPGGFVINRDQAGNPLSGTDRMMQDRMNQYEATRNSLMSQIRPY